MTLPVFAANSVVRASDLATMVTAMGTWQPWSPTYTNLTIGSGTVTARYIQADKKVIFGWAFVYGSGSAVGSNPRFTLPAAPAAYYTAQIGVAQLNDASVGQQIGTVAIVSGSTVELLYIEATNNRLAAITATVPFTWTTSDGMVAFGQYEAA